MKNISPKIPFLLFVTLVLGLSLNTKLSAQIDSLEGEKAAKEVQFQKIIGDTDFSLSKKLTIEKAMEIKVPEDYATIQEAVEMAAEGATILVSGEKAEGFSILGLKNLQIKTENNTLITARLDPILELTTAFAISQSENIKIQGFKISGRAYVAYSSGIEIVECDISGPGDGISLLYSNKNLIQNNILQKNTGDGIEFGSGLYIYSSNENIFNSNRIEKNEAFGIALFFSNNNLFQDNEIKENVGGIELNTRSTGNIIKDNKISNSKLWGIRIIDQANSNDLDNNIFDNSDGSGIIISRSENNCIKNGSIKNSGYAGISILDKGSQNNLIEEVLVTKNFIGVEFALGAKDSFFNNCRITGNEVCDVRDFQEANNFVETTYASINCP